MERHQSATTRKEIEMPKHFSILPIAKLSGPLRKLHSPAKPTSNPDPSLVSSTNLIKLHCDRGSFAHARNLLDEIPNRDVVAWTAMISGLTSHSQYSDAWAAFKDMLADGVGPNAHTLSSILKACKGGPHKERARAAHGVAVRRGVDRAPHVGNALLDAYAESDGGAADAVAVFGEMEERNVVTWTTMIAAYMRWGDGWVAIRTFKQMIQEGAEWNAFTLSIAIRACASIRNLTLGRQIHAAVVKSGHETNLPVANSLVDLYARCMSLSEAKKYFSQMPERDLITWNTMIAGLDRSGSPEVFHLLLEMVSRSISPNSFTFTSIVSACAHLVVLNFGQQVHATIIRRGFSLNQLIANALINMYTKCGCIADSEKIFDEIEQKDLVSWTSMMIGYGINGFGKEAIELFEEMIRTGIQPDSVVFMGLLSACSHAGLVDEGLKYFDSMSIEYNVQPEMEVYGCVVDLLGRAGKVVEAYRLIEAMQFEPDESIWGALLGACKVHKNVELGVLAAQSILDLKPNRAKTYVMMSNIYAARKEWDEVGGMRRLMREVGSAKEAGRSSVEVRDGVCSFVAGESSNTSVGLAYEVLEMMFHHMDERFDLEGSSDFCGEEL